MDLKWLNFKIEFSSLNSRIAFDKTFDCLFVSKVDDQAKAKMEVKPNCLQ
jgi:hypothetical protein